MLLPSCSYEMTYPGDACFLLLPSCPYEMNEPDNEMAERIFCKSLFQIGFSAPLLILIEPRICLLTEG
jgi:hypothetical protein